MRPILPPRVRSGFVAGDCNGETAHRLGLSDFDWTVANGYEVFAIDPMVHNQRVHRGPLAKFPVRRVTRAVETACENLGNAQ